MLHIHLRSIDLLCGKEISFKKFRAYDTIERFHFLSMKSKII